MEEFYDYLEHDKTYKDFIKNFGGEITWGFEYGVVYFYGKHFYSLMSKDKDFKKDVQKSMEQGENLLLKYPMIK